MARTGVIESMAKNIVKSVPAASADADESGLVATEGGLMEAQAGADVVVVGAESLKAEAPTLGSGPIRIRLHESHGASPSGQIAAQSAMRTAYFCLYGKPFSPSELSAWAEGGIDLRAEKRDAEILERILKTLGIVVEIRDAA